jgi:Trk-type K+ transport system membrane component
MQPLSKLILCAVMLRGRHRGLPLAIDRAIMLKSELERAEEAFSDDDDDISDSDPVIST